ncbi:unnamed protein product [Caenorhabditis angaria]|uniref:Uncharacterized protein n=1 Tax=Caenorhabditis angaria TaxID=860376 RepID=A0A9P1IBC9_9PELO|nr:unnamed protein product [Caenorhabditis angaria]
MIEINPWTKISTKESAASIYRVDRTIDLVDFTVNGHEETEPSLIPFQKEMKEEFCQIMGETKKNIQLEEHQRFSIERTNCKLYDEASSSHMVTLIEAKRNCFQPYPETELLTTVAALKIIGDTILHPAKNWKIRAYREVIDRKRCIILCSENENVFEIKSSFPIKRDEEMLDSMCEINSAINKMTEDNRNKSICGAQFVESEFRLENKSIKACVFGEIDMIIGVQNQIRFRGLITTTYNKIERNHRISFTDTELFYKSFENTWPRAFWIGIPEIIYALRQDSEMTIESLEKVPIEWISKRYNCGTSRLVDQSVWCVAKVLFEIKSMFESKTNSPNNILVTYAGAINEDEDVPIILDFCPNSYSFRLLQEQVYLKKILDEMNNNDTRTRKLQ